MSGNTRFWRPVPRKAGSLALPSRRVRPLSRLVQASQGPLVQASSSLDPEQTLGILKWQATGVPIMDRLASLGPGPESVTMAAQHVVLSLILAYSIQFVAKSWMRKIHRNQVTDLRLSGTKKTSGTAWTLVHSAVPVASSTIPLLAIFYSTTIMFSLLAVHEMHLRNVLLYTFVDEGLVVKWVMMLSQFFQDVVDTLLIYATTLFVRNVKDILVKQHLIKSITDGEFAEVVSKTGVRGNNKPLVRIIDVVNVMLTYLLYFVAFVASLDAFGFDVTPLVASVSGLSVLVGIGMREVLENVAGALTLYLAPPFAVGDRVRFITVDGVDTVQPVAEGVVEEVGVLRTVIHTNTSRFYLANAMLLKLVVEQIKDPDSLIRES